MTQAQVLAYVNATAAALGLPLEDEQALRVAGHLGRTAGLAKLLEDVPLQPCDEPAEIYLPAPFRTFAS